VDFLWYGNYTCKPKYHLARFGYGIFSSVVCDTRFFDSDPKNYLRSADNISLPQALVTTIHCEVLTTTKVFFLLASSQRITNRIQYFSVSRFTTFGIMWNWTTKEKKQSEH
jgi:hypothetical protein